MKYLRRLFPFLKDKYVLAVVIFLVWLTFFDRNDFFAQHSYREKLNELRTEKQYYSDEIQKNKQAMQSLGDKKNLEKFAREKYLMKKDNEDIFVVVKEK